jgi:hypothetical protein
MVTLLAYSVPACRDQLFTFGFFRYNQVSILPNQAQKDSPIGKIGGVFQVLLQD